MARRKDEPPAYKIHQASGRAYYYHGGRRHYLGRHGTPEAKQAYRQVVASWERQHAAPSFRPAAGCTLAELAAAFLEHADRHYRDADGRHTKEFADYKRNLTDLLAACGELPAGDFRPSHLKALRDRWVRDGLTRLTVNKQVGRLKRVFAWGVEEELVEEDVCARLYRVKGLQEGRTEAPERDDVLPVPLRDLAAVLRVAPEPLAPMLRLGYYAGARPGEICRMRAEEVRTDGVLKLGKRTVNLAGQGVWLFAPRKFKQKHAGKVVIYVLGPRCQRLLAPYLERVPAGYLFSPAERVRAERAARRKARQSKVPPSQRDRGKQAPRRAPGEHYRTESYGRAVERLCRKAGVEPFGPNRLRHNYATRMDQAAGLETTAEALGHSKGQVTEIYIERKLRRVAEVRRQLG